MNKKVIAVLVVVSLILINVFFFSGYLFSVFKAAEPRLLILNADTPRRGAGDWWFDVSRGGSASMGDFKIGTQKNDGYDVYGGTKSGCGYKLKITKNEEILHEDTSWISAQHSPFDETFDGILKIRGPVESWEEIGFCKMLLFEASYILPKKAITIYADSPERSYIRGTDIEIEVKIYNNFKEDLPVEVIVDACIPTFADIYCKTYTKEKILPLGETILHYEIPSERVTDILRITPKVKVYPPEGFFRGLIYDNKNVEDQKILLGEFSGDVYEIMINPEPIYVTIDCIQKACPTGYSCQDESGLCVRTDVLEKQLPCQQIGCPVTPDKTYECSSSGVCVETVFKYVKCPDSPCPEGTKCDTGSGMCINEMIFENVVQCTSPGDCMIPCEGMRASCEDNQCTYEGECDLTVVQCLVDIDCQDIPKPCSGVEYYCTNDNKCSLRGNCENIYIEYDCSKSECPEGYRCDTSFTPAVCVKEITKESITTKILGCEDLGCPKNYQCQNGVCMKAGGLGDVNWLWIILATIIGGFIGLITLLIFRKKR